MPPILAVIGAGSLKILPAGILDGKISPLEMRRLGGSRLRIEIQFSGYQGKALAKACEYKGNPFHRVCNIDHPPAETSGMRPKGG